MIQETWSTRHANAVAQGISVMCDFYTERAENAEIWDVEGNRYIDFAAGIAVTNTGHRHPKIVRAISQQLQQFTHTAFQVTPYQSYIELAEKINALVPGSGTKKTAFFTTGAEAVENAIKIARAATGRTGVIAFAGAFHGRTYMALSLTGKVAAYKQGFGPLAADVFHAPFPNELQGISVDDALKGLDHILTVEIDPKRVAAIIIEPVQGEGGFNVAPPDFLRALRTICDEHGILLIADEVQTGFARTGKMFAIEHSGVVPDMMTLAKSLAGGMPLSAVCGRADIMDAPAAGGLGGTYAGNPLSLAAALAVLDVIESENLIDRANDVGQRLISTLRALQSTTPEIADVRGLGAMVAVEFKDPETNRPNPQFAKKVQQHALQNGLILLTCGSAGQVIRFLCPLTIQDDVLTEGLHILSNAIRS